MSPRQLAERLEAGTAPRLIDVREPWEHDLAKLPGAELKPLSEMQAWWPELDQDDEIVFYCHTGRRSGMVCAYLSDVEGFRHLHNLEGGIEAWSLTVDPAVPRY
jgi:adenylyltransferase/sulfurtransferase